MVSFRFHLVSLVAVFLAIALGIVMGVTVIDRVGVERLQSRLDQVRKEVNAANQRSDRLQVQQTKNEDYENASAGLLIDNKLRDTPVTIVAVRGIDEGPLNDLRKSLTDSGCRLQGVLWFSKSASLTDPSATNAAQRALSVPSGDVNQLRSAFLSRVSAVMAGATPPESLDPLLDAGLIEWQPDSGKGSVPTQVSTGKIVFASGAHPSVGNDQLAQPFVKLLAAQPARRVVAVESGKDADDASQTERGVFTSVLRNDSSLDNRLSTVDDIDLITGRVATVLALSQLPDRTGDYGVASGATGTIPSSKS